MSYTPTNWQNGDVITAEKLNKLENGVANANAGALIVHITGEDDNLALDKTAGEIINAMPLAFYEEVTEEEGYTGYRYPPFGDGNNAEYQILVVDEQQYYCFSTYDNVFAATSLDDYPDMATVPQ